MKKRILVICGGPSAEAEVSRTSAKAVVTALTTAGFRVDVAELGPALAATEFAIYDAAFPLCHGPVGEDGCLQGLLEMVGLPYVGSGVLACALAMDKVAAKVHFRAAGLPVAEEVCVYPRDLSLETATGLLERFRTQGMVIKPRFGGSAIATTLLRQPQTPGEVLKALEAALNEDEAALVEELIVGDELTCGVVELVGQPARALPPTRIYARAAAWYDFDSRYALQGSEHECPAKLPESQLCTIQASALRAHRAVFARDLSRVDFVHHAESGRTVLLEVNAIPGMTATSLFPEQAQAIGLDLPTLCAALVQRALTRQPRTSPTALPMP